MTATVPHARPEQAHARRMTHTPALKGLGHAGRDAAALKQLKALGLLDGDAWHYTWRSRYNVTPTGFVPMVRDAGDLDEDAINRALGQLPQTRATALLGFNEPDHKSQAAMTVFEALRLWPQLEKAGLRLGSPATVKPNSPWLEEFMTKAERQGRRVDFMTAHSYGWPNADSFLGKLEAMHKLYQRPIWVTEYAVADFEARTKKGNRYTTEQVEQFMRETVEGMREMPYVERFAWKTRTVNDPAMWVSALFQNDGSLTSRGRLYASL